MSEIKDDRDAFIIGLDWSRWWTIIPEIVALVCAGVLPIVVAIGVVARYTNWFHVPWAQDVTKVLFLLVVFLGGAIAVKYDAHVRMSTLSDSLETRFAAGSWWAWVIRLSPIIIGVLLLILGVPVVQITMQRELPSLQISAGYFSTVIPISGALIIVYVLRNLILALKSRSAGAASQAR